MLGIGGGILFVPTLTLVMGLSQLRAEATSLLAIIPVAALGALRQWRYGNIELRDGAVLGVLSGGGVVAGVLLAKSLPQHVLRLGFAAVMMVVALQLLRRSWRAREAAQKSAIGEQEGE